MREECSKCNHLPMCKDELKNNLSENCPYYEPERKSILTIKFNADDLPDKCESCGREY